MTTRTPAPDCHIGDPMKATRYPDDADFTTGLRMLRSAAGPASADLIRRTGLVVFTPGCLAAGQVPTGLSLLAGAGFNPVLCQQFRFTAEQVRRMWRYQLTSFRPDRWRLILDLLLIGPSLLVVVDRPAPDGPAATELTRIKGVSDPRLGRPGQLRTELGAANKIINLMHSAEEPADVLRETAILLDEQLFRAAWSPRRIAAVRQNGGGSSAGRWAGVAGPAVRWAGVSFAHAATALCWRIAETIAARTGGQDERDSDRDALAGLGQARLLLDDRLAWLETVDSRRPLTALAAYRERYPEPALTRPLAETIRSARPDDLRTHRLLDALENLELGLAADRCDLDALWCACDQAGFEVDRWDRLIVSTHQVTADL